LNAVAFAIAEVDAETIDRINIRQASLLAMRRAVEQLALSPDFLLIDGRDTIDWDCEQQAVVRGDATSFSIAAASVLAKVYRDRLLVELDGRVSRLRPGAAQGLRLAGAHSRARTAGADATASQELSPGGAGDAAIRISKGSQAGRGLLRCIHSWIGRASSNTASTIVIVSGVRTPGLTCHQ
jgi:hypothetical protein